MSAYCKESSPFCKEFCGLASRDKIYFKVKSKSTSTDKEEYAACRSISCSVGDTWGSRPSGCGQQDGFAVWKGECPLTITGHACCAWRDPKASPSGFPLFLSCYFSAMTSCCNHYSDAEVLLIHSLFWGHPQPIKTASMTDFLFGRSLESQ